MDSGFFAPEAYGMRGEERSELDISGGEDIFPLRRERYTAF